MATSRKPRERTSPAASSQPVRRDPKASVTSSPNREVPTLPEKPIPNYLKPTIRTAATTARSPTTTTTTRSSTTTTTIRSLNTTTTTSRPPARKPAGQPPSPSSSRPSSRDRAPSPRTSVSPRTSPSPSPSPKTSVSPRTSFDKSPRTAAGGLPRSVKSAPAAAKRRVRTGNINSSASVASTAADAYASDTSSIKSETEEKELLIHEILVDDLVLDIPSPKEQLLEDEQLADPSVVLNDPEDPADSAPHQTEVSAEITNDAELADDAQTETEVVKPVVVEVAPAEEADEAGKTEAEENALDAEVEAVLLKPREAPEVVQGAKTEALRSNEVIEEFKSKMMVKRKNKVLALVGAFETIMSLQEPATTGGQQQQTNRGGALPDAGCGSTVNVEQAKGGAAPPDAGNGSATKEEEEHN